MDIALQRRRVLLATCVSYVVVILDTSIVNLALDRIGRELAGSIASLPWVLNAYTLVFASVLLTGGTLADRFGARRVYIAGLSVFAAASAGCGLAGSLPELVAARVLQGAGAALLVPASMALIGRTWHDLDERAAVFGLWAGLGGMAMASGPLVGGVLVGMIGWRSIFLVNVPICLAGIVLALRVAPDRPAAGERRLDVVGQVCAVVMLVGLNVTLFEGPTRGWGTPWVVASALVTLAAAGAFVFTETTVVQPMLPMRMFRSAAFSGAVFASMVSAFTLYGLLFELSLVLQQQFTYAPLQAGLAFLPLTLFVPVGSLLSSRAIRWLGAGRVVTGAFVMSAAGFAALAMAGREPAYWQLALPLPAIGLAASLITPATAASAMSAVDDRAAGIAAGVLNAARQTGTAVGVTVAGMLIFLSHSSTQGLRLSALLAAGLSLIAATAWGCASMRAPAPRALR